MGKGISSRNLNKAREMLQEAGKNHGRAILLLNDEDYSGSVEASQHCVEIAIKSLFKLVGLEYEKIHDPGKFIDQVLKELEKITPDLVANDGTGLFYRLKYLSQRFKRLHAEAMYGYNGVPASKIFTKIDAEYFINRAFEVLFDCLLTLLGIGYLFNFLSEEERAGFEALIRYFGQELGKRHRRR